MRWGWYSLSNMNGDNLFLSFVSINSESNAQERGKGTHIPEKGLVFY